MLLMTATDLEAVVFLSCLRSILEPDRAWPTLCEAIHYPANALRDLDGRRGVQRPPSRRVASYSTEMIIERPSTFCDWSRRAH